MTNELPRGVPVAFALKVREHVMQADKDARMLMDESEEVLEQIRQGIEDRRDTLGTNDEVEPVRNRITGCKGCGVPLDDNNPDCSTCKSRHEMRAHAARARANHAKKEVEKLADNPPKRIRVDLDVMGELTGVDFDDLERKAKIRVLEWFVAYTLDLEGYSIDMTKEIR